MAKPIEQWDENDILGLPPGENDTFERKGSMLLDLSIPGVNENDVLNELAKQVSAFANTGGGRIFYGVTDDGRVDNGGIATSVKGKTKQWLEDVVRAQTEFEILGYNVYEVLPLQNGTSITAGKALYIVDIPDSDRAPHQSRRDFKYYIRVASKSLPAPHRILEDIRNRQKHPDVNLSGISLEVVQLPTFSYTRPALTLRDSTPTFEGAITLRFHVSLKNTSQVIAKNTCFQLRSSEPG